MASNPALVDWDLAEWVAIRIAEREDYARIHEGVQLLDDFGCHTERAEQLVAQTTGLVSLEGPACVRVLDRPDWIRANLRSFRRLLGPALQGLENRPQGSGMQLLERVGGIELGVALGWMSIRVLGQYDLLVLEEEENEDQGLLYYIGPNVVAAERRYAFFPSEFRLWLALHEVTHRAQFTGVPWMREYYLRLVESLLNFEKYEQSISTEKFRSYFKRFSGFDKSKDSGVRDIFTNPKQSVAFERITGLMSLLEGHGDFTMGRAGTGLIEDAERFARVMRDRRRSSTGPARLFQRLIGLEAKLAQYAEGEVFVETVDSQGGTELLDRVWECADNLPERKEISDPWLWIERMAAQDDRRLETTGVPESW